MGWGGFLETSHLFSCRFLPVFLGAKKEREKEGESSMLSNVNYATKGAKNNHCSTNSMLLAVYLSSNNH